MGRSERLWIAAAMLAGLTQNAQSATNLVIDVINRNGTVVWENYSNETQYATGYTVEWAPTPAGPWGQSWDQLVDIDATSATYEVSVPMFYRVMAVVTNTPAPPADMYAHLPFAGDMIDATGNGHNGTSYSWEAPTLTADRFGSEDEAYYFDGADLTRLSNTSSTSPTPPEFPTTNLTVCAWFRPNRDLNNQQLIGNFYWGNRDGWCLKLGDGETLGFFFEAYIDKTDQYGNPFTWMGARSGVHPDLETWYHVAGSFEINTNTTLRVYVNGELEDEATIDGAWPWIRPAIRSIALGDNHAGNEPYQGAIDDIRIYERVLTDDEVLRVYEAH